ncbi:motility associated factor glycosyltransferase family protein [Lysinibacillus sp. NPDC097214]|uniref:motility associated factor glycosyltransferase family protein n=1 Tax=Lysinibacillus sp. NPDC097214 TaxID=3390584 RepID=UPI003D008966
MSKYKIEYIKTRNNLETVTLNGYLLHSKYDPIQEASRIVDKEFEEGYVHILFGYGLGYITEVLNEKIEDATKLIIIDPIYPLINVGEKTKKNTIINQIEKKELEVLIAGALKNLSKKVKVICSPNYDKIFPNEMKRVLEVIKEVQKMLQVHENTIRVFSDNWQENFIQNLFNLSRDSSLEELKKTYSCPVVLASGGPSLTKQLSLLKEIKNQVIIIAAGSTINSLLAKGIEPDYIVTIDGGLENYNHFKDIPKIKSQLIYAITSHYRIQDEYPNNKYAFLAASNQAYGEHIKRVFSIDLPRISGGGSVANFAYSIAAYITTGPIAIIGQDLAYTDDKSHAESNKRFKKVDVDFMKSRGTIEIPGYYGDMVVTDYPFLSMKKSFEVIHQNMQHDSPIYNCTEGGAKIEGMDQLSFVDFCEAYVYQQCREKKEIVEENNYRKINTSIFISKMNELISIYNHLIKQLELALKLLNQNKSLGTFNKSTLSELSKIDKNLEKKLKQVSLNYLTDPITLDILRNYEPKLNEGSIETYTRVYNQSKELYSRLLEAVKKTKQYTLDTIDKAKTYERGNENG